MAGTSPGDTTSGWPYRPRPPHSGSRAPTVLGWRMTWNYLLRSSPPDPPVLCRRQRVALWQRAPAGHGHTREPTACLTCRRRARLGRSVPPNALSWGATALWLVRVLRIREDYTMSFHLLGDLVTRALLAVPLSPL